MNRRAIAHRLAHPVGGLQFDRLVFDLGAGAAAVGGRQRSADHGTAGHRTQRRVRNPTLPKFLQRVRELAVQANTATNDQTARQAIVAELQVRMGELVDTANTRDANGDYLGFETEEEANEYIRGIK